MAEIRELFAEVGLLESVDPAAFHQQPDAPDPWAARASGLDRGLTDGEFAAALMHIAKHRGFKSTRKSDLGRNAPKEDQKMLGAISANKELLARYRSVGEMVVKDGRFRERKRNKGGEYTQTHSRDDLECEATALFAEQRRLGNPKATWEIEQRYHAIAFRQRPWQDSEELVGLCPFEDKEKRSPRHAPSFERFRFLAKLNTVKIREANGNLRRLTREELNKALANFGQSSKSISWNALARMIGLPKGSLFDGVDDKKAGKDVVSSGGCAEGTKTFHSLLGSAGWNAVADRPAVLDQAAAIIAFRESLDSIETGLRELEGLPLLVLNALVGGVRNGSFAHFARAGHISAKAACNLLPYLLDGMVYSEACVAAGYDPTQTRNVRIEDIRNPVVQRSLREAIKQVETLVHHFSARPGRIIVELGRDVGKSAEERSRITNGLKDRTADKERLRLEMKELLGLAVDPGEEDLRRFELWKEQGYCCVYSGKEISPPDILSTSNVVQIDHVLPRSRSQDNSYHNQVLCLAKANQDKAQRTPWEWMVRDDRNDTAWKTFEERVRTLSIKGIKKRNLLMINFDERERGFVARNLNDTRYVARVLLAALRELYPDDDEPDPGSKGYLSKKCRLFARPGQITAILRRSWGVDALKDRADDRHHALDAIIGAAVPSDWLLNNLTQQYQQLETENRAKWTPSVTMPWKGFAQDVRQAYEQVFVSRSERRRGRGAGHGDTIYRMEYQNGQKVTFERKSVVKLTKADLSRLKDADGGNRPLAASLANWIERGKPSDDPPRSAKGDLVRKVLLKRPGASGFDLSGGHVDNADMVRVDVFKRLGKFYLVPVYRHQVMNPGRWALPPNMAVEIRRPTSEWTVITDNHEFLFSLYPDSYIELKQNNGTTQEGYFRGLNINDAGIVISPQNLRQGSHKIGSKTLRSLQKFHVDRLGRKHLVEREPRLWHGVACT